MHIDFDPGREYTFTMTFLMPNKSVFSIKVVARRLEDLLVRG